MSIVNSLGSFWEKNSVTFHDENLTKYAEPLMVLICFCHGIARGGEILFTTLWELSASLSDF